MSLVYLGGPITGLTFDEATDWREQTPLPEGWQGLSPMRDKEKFRIEGPLPSTFDEGSQAVEQDLFDIRVMDVGLWNFLGAERASIGSCVEIGYAFALAKPIVIVQEPAGPAFDTGESVDDDWKEVGWQTRPRPNPHDHIFIHEFATFECSTMDDALEWLAEYRDVNTPDGYAHSLVRND